MEDEPAPDLTFYTTLGGHPFDEGNIFNKNPNSDDHRRQALRGIQEGKPTTWGGRMRDPDNQEKCYEHFVSRSVPDVNAKTRIIAVVGISDNTPKTADDGSPQKDGWFLSDFFAFWNLLQAKTPHQTWLHCLDLKTLVQKHERYLHGNPYKTRKVVLDDAILSKCAQSPHAPQYVPPKELCQKFQQVLKTECEAAGKQDEVENVLALIFAHGMLKAHSLVLGEGISQKLTKKKFAACIKGTGASVTLVTSACFSGGWACQPNLDINLYTAAGDAEESHSWRYSNSLGKRACGSMFATTMIESLIGQEEDFDQPDAGTEESKALAEAQAASHAEFTKTVFQTLLRKVDRRGYDHRFTFQAADDAWEACWRERSGFPNSDYASRWSDLQDWPRDETLNVGDWYNRAPEITGSKEEQEYFQSVHDRMILPEIGKEGLGDQIALDRIPATATMWWPLDALVKRVAIIGEQYLDLFVGQDEGANTMVLHQQIRDICSGTERRRENIEEVLPQIDYRLGQMELADTYVRELGLDMPDGQPCSEFNLYKVYRQENWKEGNKRNKLYRLLEDRLWKLFPGPLPDQGRDFVKGQIYFLVALMRFGLSNEEIESRVDQLVADVMNAVGQEVAVLKRDEEVAPKRRKLRSAMEAFAQSTGRALRGWTPATSRSSSRASSVTGTRPTIKGKRPASFALTSPAWLQRRGSHDLSPSTRTFFKAFRDPSTATPIPEDAEAAIPARPPPAVPSRPFSWSEEKFAREGLAADWGPDPDAVASPSARQSRRLSLKSLSVGSPLLQRRHSSASPSKQSSPKPRSPSPASPSPSKRNFPSEMDE